MPKKQKGFVFRVSLFGLLIGLLSAVMIAIGLFLFSSVISGRISFVDSPYPRQDRAVWVLLSWCLISAPFLILAPNRHGITSSLGMFLGLYLSFAYTTGSIYVFDSTDFMIISQGIKTLIAPIYFIVVLIVLLYNAVSGQEFFRSAIFGGVAIGFLAIGAYMGILV